MMIREYLPFPPLRVAVGVLILAGIFAAWSLFGALRAPGVAVAAARPPVMVALAPPTSLAAVDVDAAVRGDLFSPDRAAPDEPFRMPGDAAPEMAQPSAPRPAVLGTAVSPNGFSFATAQLAGGRPRIVHQGDQLGDFIVTSIGRGHVVFTTPTGTRLDIAASAASTQDSFNASITPEPAAPDTSDRSFTGRGAARRRGRGGAVRDTLPPG